MCAYRILSMDGGGIRGVLTARILERLEQAVPGFLASVDLFAGSSTGGLLAVGLASGKTAGEMRGLYQTLAEAIFGKEGPLDELYLNVKELVSARYSYQGLKNALTDNFQAKTLSQLNKRVLISTFLLDNEGQSSNGVRSWKMKFFENYPHPGSDGSELVVDVAVRTAMAPAYFPIYQGYVDGGVAACNPAMCALAQAMEKDTGRQLLENIRLLSLGTGFNPHYIPEKEADWGMLQWLPHILNVMLEGSAGLVDYQCRQILDTNYCRVDAPLPVPIELGDIKYIPEMLQVAENVPLEPIVDWVKGCFLVN